MKNNKKPKPKVDTPHEGSWAEQMAQRPKAPERSEAENRLMRAGIVHPEIANAMPIGGVELDQAASRVDELKAAAPKIAPINPPEIK